MYQGFREHLSVRSYGRVATSVRTRPYDGADTSVRSFPPAEGEKRTRRDAEKDKVCSVFSQTEVGRHPRSSRRLKQTQRLFG
ncbi:MULTISPECIES: hypothetical protein [Mediterranea]|uniref:hypothetical protein n=1 Tax=Mediterranea TaxID=1926659 RepID=UPI002012AF45|nr:MULTISPECIES: hypothetical protein [Mediterranea]MCL1606940.1 hypothetical protein [Mediterranea sp. ET5]MDM8121784.1 hypothetical protein [Mediterranea massiliensis]MDM8197451.1 hypothetical protein [Mediterranea massiliensis]